MNLNQLQYFYEVGKHGGYSHASRALGIQQPAISRMVAQLEESLKLLLFERIGNRVRLTHEGMALYAECQTIFEKLEHLERNARQLREECQGPLVIGCSDLIASELVPMALASLLKEHPKITPTIVSAPASDLCARIVDGRIDVGLSYYIPTQFESKLAVSKLITHSFSLYVSHDSRKSETTLKTFIGSREVDEPAPKSFPALTALRGVAPGAKICISANSHLAHRKLVLQGFGVSILPDYLMSEDLRQKRVERVSESYRPLFPLFSVVRSSASPSRAAGFFMSAIREPKAQKQREK